MFANSSSVSLAEGNAGNLVVHHCTNMAGPRKVRAWEAQLRSISKCGTSLY